MTLYKVNSEEHEKKELRKFGVIMSAFIALVFGAFFPYVILKKDPILIPWLFSFILLFTGLFYPILLRPVYRVWMAFAKILNKVNTTIILCLIFYGVFTPFGVIFRFFTKASQKKRFNVNCKTYRLESRKYKKNHMERMF